MLNYANYCRSFAVGELRDCDNCNLLITPILFSDISVREEGREDSNGKLLWSPSAPSKTPSRLLLKHHLPLPKTHTPHPLRLHFRSRILLSLPSPSSTSSLPFFLGIPIPVPIQTLHHHLLTPLPHPNILPSQPLPRQPRQHARAHATPPPKQALFSAFYATLLSTTCYQFTSFILPLVLSFHLAFFRNLLKFYMIQWRKKNWIQTSSNQFQTRPWPYNLVCPDWPAQLVPAGAGFLFRLYLWFWCYSNNRRFVRTEWS